MRLTPIALVLLTSIVVVVVGTPVKPITMPLDYSHHPPGSSEKLMFHCTALAGLAGDKLRIEGKISPKPKIEGLVAKKPNEVTKAGYDKIIETLKQHQEHHERERDISAKQVAEGEIQYIAPNDCSTAQQRTLHHIEQIQHHSSKARNEEEHANLLSKHRHLNDKDKARRAKLGHDLALSRARSTTHNQVLDDHADALNDIRTAHPDIAATLPSDITTHLDARRSQVAHPQHANPFQSTSPPSHLPPVDGGSHSPYGFTSPHPGAPGAFNPSVPPQPASYLPPPSHNVPGPFYPPLSHQSGAQQQQQPYHQQQPASPPSQQGYPSSPPPQQGPYNYPDIQPPQQVTYYYPSSPSSGSSSSQRGGKTGYAIDEILDTGTNPPGGGKTR